MATIRRRSSSSILQQVSVALFCLPLILILTSKAHASYLLSQQQQVSEATNVAVTSAPPSINPFSFNQNVQENNRIIVVCSTSSSEIPTTYSWLKDGLPLNPTQAQARRVVIKSDSDSSTLKIYPVRLEDAGSYTCSAKNRVGSQAYSAQLVVHAEPRWFKEPNHEPIVTTRGQTVVIDCQTTGWPRPQQTWHIKSEYLSHVDAVRETTKATSGVCVQWLFFFLFWPRRRIEARLSVVPANQLRCLWPSFNAPT